MDHVNEILSSTETKDDDEGLIAYARKFNNACNYFIITLNFILLLLKRL